MNKYEMTLVVSANIEEEARNAVFDQVRDLITKNGGEITDPGTPEKKRLAYEIQKMNEGWYAFIKFNAEPEAPAQIEKQLRITANVLRFLTVKDGE
jgi:small subunit ribosomal protein S6